MLSVVSRLNEHTKKMIINTIVRT